ncbi:MAG: M1 family metallopeptidase [Planctomycetota bacterium]
MSVCPSQRSHRAVPVQALALLLLCWGLLHTSEITITAPDRALRREPLAPVEPAPAHAAAIAAGTRSADGAPGSDWWQNRATYELAVTVDPSQARAEASGTLTYHNASPDRLERIELELALNLHRAGAPWKRNQPPVTGGMVLESVVVDGIPAVELGSDEDPPEGIPAHRVDYTRWTIHPVEPLAPGASLELQVRWHCDLPRIGAGGRMGGDAEHYLHLAYWYPLFRIYDDVLGWHTAPFQGAAEFHPPFGDHRVSLTAPGDWLVIGTGTWESVDEHLSSACLQRLQEALGTETGGLAIAEPETWAEQTGLDDPARMRTWHFDAPRQRQTVLTLLRGVHWQRGGVTVAEDGAPVAVDGFWREQAPPSWQEVVPYQQQALDFLSRFTGLTYPWPHMYAVEAHGLVGGGMEYPMATLILGTGDPSQLYNITAHELAHMWYPMIVGMDERLFGWFDEGFATHAENQARRAYARFPDWDGEAEERRWYRNQARFGADVAIHRHSDSFADDWDYFLSAYAKPSAVYATLRELLGEAVWHDCIRTFTREWAWRHPYPQDFFATVERVSGRQLDWFWRSWFLEPWSADHGIWDVRRRDGRWQVVVRDHGQAVLSTQVHIALADGGSRRVTIPAAHWLDGHRFAILTLPPDLEPVRVQLDPEDESLDVEPGNDSWRRLPPQQLMSRDPDTSPRVVLPDPETPEPLPEIP